MDDKDCGRPLALNVEMLLDALRATAQEGLSYTESAYDRERYRKLLDLACAEYASITGVDADAIRDLFLKEQRSITPKVGVDVAGPNRNGEILILRLPNGQWCSGRMDGCWRISFSRPRSAKPMRKPAFMRSSRLYRNRSPDAFELSRINKPDQYLRWRRDRV